MGKGSVIRKKNKNIQKGFVLALLCWVSKYTISLQQFEWYVHINSECSECPGNTSDYVKLQSCIPKCENLVDLFKSLKLKL